MGDIVVGVDIGGTKIAAGLVNSQGKILKKKVFPTFSSKGVEASMGQVFLAVEEMIDCSVTIGQKTKLAGLGVCAPGPLDPVKGIVYNPPNLKGWKDIQLRDILKKKFGLKVTVENDANAAGMAELKWGAAKGFRHVLYVTVSTGIGTGVIIDGRIYHGKNGMAGEGGHVTIKYDDKDNTCGCGVAGCIEALASGVSAASKLRKRIEQGNIRGAKSILKECGDRPEDLDMRAICAAARKGNTLAKQAITEQGTLIGIWLGGMVSILDPEVIVIGGGVSFAGSLIFEPIRKTFPGHTINVNASRTPVRIAKLRRDVGIYGAASVAM